MYKLFGGGWWKLMRYGRYSAFKHSKRRIFDTLVVHPGQVSTAHLWLCAAVKETIIALHKPFMALHEVDNLISNLGHEEVCFNLCRKQMIFGDVLANLWQIKDLELNELALVHIEVSLRPAEYASVVCIRKVVGQHVESFAVVAVESSVTGDALHGCSLGQAAIARVLLVDNQLERCGNVDPLVLGIVILHELVCA